MDPLPLPPEVHGAVALAIKAHNKKIGLLYGRNWLRRRRRDALQQKFQKHLARAARYAQGRGL